MAIQTITNVTPTVVGLDTEPNLTITGTNFTPGELSVGVVDSNGNVTECSVIGQPTSTGVICRINNPGLSSLGSFIVRVTKVDSSMTYVVDFRDAIITRPEISELLNIFQNETTESIRNDMLNEIKTLEPSADISEGSTYWDMYSPPSIEISQLYNSIVEGLRLSFLLLTRGIYLDLRGIEYDVFRESGESDDSYLSRILRKARNPSRGGNKIDYENWVEEASDEVTKILPVRGSTGGNVNVYVVGQDNDNLSSDDVSIIQTYLDGVKPLVVTVSVQNATKIDFDIEMDYILNATYTFANSVEAISKVLNNYIENLPIGDDVNYFDVVQSLANLVQIKRFDSIRTKLASDTISDLLQSGIDIGDAENANILNMKLLKVPDRPTVVNSGGTRTVTWTPVNNAAMYEISFPTSPVQTVETEGTISGNNLTYTFTQSFSGTSGVTIIAKNGTEESFESLTSS